MFFRLYTHKSNADAVTDSQKLLIEADASHSKIFDNGPELWSSFCTSFRSSTPRSELISDCVIQDILRGGIG